MNLPIESLQGGDSIMVILHAEPSPTDVDWLNTPGVK